MTKKNIKTLLNKYEKKEEEIYVYNDFCHLCKNFESETEFCNTYKCFPFKTAVLAEEFCDKYIGDKIKEAEYDKHQPKKLQM